MKYCLSLIGTLYSRAYEMYFVLNSHIALEDRTDYDQHGCEICWTFTEQCS